MLAMIPECNLCGSRSFSNVKTRPLARCRGCGSYERTRLLWLYIERELKNKSFSRVLHIAPELGIYNKLKDILDPDSYTVADFQPKNYSFVHNCRHIDLTDLSKWPDKQYDMIIHSHVLEHVSCNIAYTLFHLHRMLDEHGKHICIIPFSEGRWDESFQQLSSKERIMRFGQSDHIRRFGKDDISQHLGSIMRIPSSYEARSQFSELVLKSANIPLEACSSYSINSVLIFNKNDYLLSFA